MEQKTMTRADICAAIHDQVGLSRTEASETLDCVLELISTELEAGRQVKLSSFGTFKVRHKNARVGRNPKTRVAHEITERRTVTFRPSNQLKSRTASRDVE